VSTGRNSGEAPVATPLTATTQVRVLYADTDMAGVVYHANYLRFFEAARTEALYQAGIDVARLQADEGLVFTVSAASVSYHHPARYGDVLTIEVYPTRCGPATLTLGYRVWRPGADTPCVTGSTTIAALDWARQKVVRLPQAMRERFGLGVPASAGKPA